MNIFPMNSERPRILQVCPALTLALNLVLLTLLLPFVRAGEPIPVPPPADDLRAQLEWLRSDVNTAKIATLNQVMRLTEREADAFWPVYRRYEKELATVSDEKVALIREFLTLQDSGKLDDAAADRISRRWLANVEDRLGLWRRYQKRIAKAVSPVRAAQFLQVEHQIALFIDLNIAAEMPAVGAPSKSSK